VSSPLQKLKLVGAVLKFGWIRKVVANRRAVRAGKPKPYAPGEILGDVVDQALDIADEAKPGWRQ
jgi:hypothetical protein